MVIFSKHCGFCDMIALFIDTLCRCAFRTIPDPSEGLEFMTVRLYDITVIDMDDRLAGAPFFNLGQIGVQGIFRSPFCQMFGKAVNDIYFSGRFM